MHSIGSALFCLAAMASASKQRVRDLNSESTDTDLSNAFELLLLALNPVATRTSVSSALAPRSRTVTAADSVPNAFGREDEEQETYTNEFGDTYAKYETYTGWDFSNTTHPMAVTLERNAEAAKQLNKILRRCPMTILGSGDRRSPIAKTVAEDLGYLFSDADFLIRSEFLGWESEGQDVPYELVENMSQAVTAELQNVLEVVTVAWDGISSVECSNFKSGIRVNLRFEDGNNGANNRRLKCEKDVAWPDHKDNSDVTITIPADQVSPRAGADYFNKALLKHLQDNPTNVTNQLINENWDEEKGRYVS
jgi:hypothetical protein